MFHLLLENQSYLLKEHSNDKMFQLTLFLSLFIIVVIITRPSEKPSQKNNSDITVIWVSDSFKWLMFMQNFEHGVTVFNQ